MSDYDTSILVWRERQAGLLCRRTAELQAPIVLIREDIARAAAE